MGYGRSSSGRGSSRSRRSGASGRRRRGNR